MPNWCFNYLTVTGPAEEVVRFHQQAAGFDPELLREPGDEPNVLNSPCLVPIPPELLTVDGKAARHAWKCQHWSCRSGARNVMVADPWQGGVAY